MISLVNVTKEYRLDDTTSITPISGVNLNVSTGEFLMIVGRSGSGKTTLLNLCAGLIKPTSGQVLIDGIDIQNMTDGALSALRSKKIGFIFQFQSLLPNLTVLENVAMPAAAQREAGGNASERAAELLRMVGLGERMHAYPKQLSAGELRRVAIARALMNRPEILLADEPTADLDEQTEAEIVSLLQEIHKSGVTILMITHNLELVPYSTRALKVEDGGLVQVDREEYRARGVATRATNRAERERKAEPRLQSGASEPGRRKEATAGTGRVALFSTAASAYLAIAAIIMVAFAIGLALPGAFRSTPQSQPIPTATPVQMQETKPSSTPFSTRGMGMAGVSGLSGSTAGSAVWPPGNVGGMGMFDTSGTNRGAGTSGMPGLTGMGMGMMGDMGAMGGGIQYRGLQVIIDPPAGGPFKDPELLQDMDPAPNVFEGALEAKRSQVNLNGVAANLLTYNGLYPGPMIEVEKGDTLKIKFTNSLPVTGMRNLLGIEKDLANIHTHGLHVSPEPPADDIHLVVKPGESYNYQYDLSKQVGGVLNFIHTHIGGKAAEDLWSGLVATIVVKDETPVLSGYETHTLVLKDISLYGSDPEPYFPMDYMVGKEGNIITVNGQVNPVLTAKPSQVQRWRILNASNAKFYNLALGQQQTFYVVGTDGGGLLDKPYPVTRLLMAPGERADILVKMADSPSNFKLISQPYSRVEMGMGGMGGMGTNGLSYNSGAWGSSVNTTNGWYGPGMYGPNGQTYAGSNGMCCGMGSMGGMGGMGSFQQVTLMTVTVQGNAVADSLPVTVNPAATRLNVDTTSLTKRTLYLSMGMGGANIVSADSGTAWSSMGMGMMGAAYLNQGSDMEPLVKSKLNTYEVWQIVNYTGMDHPFHQHVNEAQVLAITGGDPEYARLYTTAPARKDVTIVPAGGSITLLMPVMDFAGTTMFHCHILEHEDMGMRALWQLGDAEMQPMK